MFTSNIQWLEEYGLTYKEFLLLSLVLNEFAKTDAVVPVSNIHGMGDKKQLLNTINILTKKELLKKVKKEGDREVYVSPDARFNDFIDFLEVQNMFS